MKALFIVHRSAFIIWGGPCAEERGFAKAGGGRDECQFAVQPLVQPLDQAEADDHVRPKRRDIQFRGENGRRLTIGQSF